MKEFERQVFSQAGQDGVLEHIFDIIKTTNQFFVEFGAGDGVRLSNTANLRINWGWQGLLMDANPFIPTPQVVKREFITAENVNDILRKYLVPYEFDYLSIDIDGNDYWVWKAIACKPRVVSIEFNSNFPHDVSVTMPYNPNHVWDGTAYYGASLAALTKLANHKGYSLVHIVSNLDAFFVRNDCLTGLEAKTPQELLPMPIFNHVGVFNRDWIKVL